MKKFSKLAAFVLAAMMTVGCVGCSSSVTTVEGIQKAGVLMMSTNAEFEPFE